MQLKRKAKLPTVIGLTTKHAVCCNIRHNSEVIDNITDTNSGCLWCGLGWLICGLGWFGGGLGVLRLTWQVDVIKKSI